MHNAQTGAKSKATERITKRDNGRDSCLRLVTLHQLIIVISGISLQKNDVAQFPILGFIKKGAATLDLIFVRVFFSKVHLLCGILRCCVIYEMFRLKHAMSFVLFCFLFLNLMCKKFCQSFLGPAHLGNWEINEKKKQKASKLSYVYVAILYNCLEYYTITLIQSVPVNLYNKHFIFHKILLE